MRVAVSAVLAAVSAIVALAGNSTAQTPNERRAQTITERRQLGGKQHCRPGQACWPTAAEWSALNSTVGGRLIQVRPWAQPCFVNPTPYDFGGCENVKNSYHNGIARLDVGTTQLDNWSYCNSNEGDAQDCGLVSSAPTLGAGLPFGRKCSLGRISPYAVAVSNADDISKALAFAKAKNIKIAIKNTGHDYLGRSTAADSLMIWTRNLNSIRYEASYLGSQAIVMGAGVLAQDAYAFANKNGKVLTLGAYASVGVAGGFAMGGGHGPLAPKYGLAVDNILEYTVVKANGAVVKANRNSNRDLFWALRGGGGGTFGVVVETVFKTYDDERMSGLLLGLSYNGHVAGGDKDSVAADFITQMATLQRNWTDLGLAGYTFFYDGQLFMAQGAQLDKAVFEAAVKPLLDYVDSRRLDFTVITKRVEQYPNFEEWRKVTLSADSVTPVGYAERLAGRLIPVGAFKTPEGRSQLAKDIVLAQRQNAPTLDEIVRDLVVSTIPLQIYSTGPRPTSMGGPTGAETAANPAWRNSLWEVVIASAWGWGASDEVRARVAQRTHDAAASIRKYSTGCYYNEADVLEENWQQAFFGANYPRLLSIKRAVDPSSLFTVWKGVGWETQQGQPNYRCYQKA